MSYFRVESREHYDLYEGDKSAEGGVFLISTSAKKTLRRRMQWLAAKVAAATAQEEAVMKYQKQIDFFNKWLADRGLTIETAGDREAPF